MFCSTCWATRFGQSLKFSSRFTFDLVRSSWPRNFSLLNFGSRRLKNFEICNKSWITFTNGRAGGKFSCFWKPASSSVTVSKTPAATEDKDDLNKETNTAEVAEAWTQRKVILKNLPGYYLRLSKIRLTGLVVLTSMAGYALAPGAVDISTFLFASLGTGLCSCSANSVNQWLEVPFDCQMARTQNRVLVRGLLSPTHVLLFGLATGTLGLSILLTEVNGLTALLGMANIFLYTSVYTPLKRVSILNTWAGSVVGALPPLMGWAACVGTLNPGAFVLAGILYSWQFPHFNALSWNLRADYSRAGYRMMSVTDPALCRQVALRHCLALIGLSSLFPVCDVTTWWLVADSLPLNLWLTWLGWKFYRNSDTKSARELFRFTLLHLPLLMILIMLHKKPKRNNDKLTESTS